MPSWWKWKRCVLLCVGCICGFVVVHVSCRVFCVRGICVLVAKKYVHMHGARLKCCAC